MEKEFQIELPDENFKVGDYVQSTEHHDKILGHAVFGRIFAISDLRGWTDMESGYQSESEEKALLHIVTKSGDKQTINKYWVNKINPERE